MASASTGVLVQRTALKIMAWKRLEATTYPDLHGKATGAGEFVMVSGLWKTLLVVFERRNWPGDLFNCLESVRFLICLEAWTGPEFTGKPPTRLATRNKADAV